MNYEEALKQKLIRMFPEEHARQRVVEILSDYGLEAHEQEPFRVQLAVLKLSGPDIGEVEMMTKYAKEDFRDILTWAEHPRQGKKWSVKGSPQFDKLVEADRQEYEQWLLD